MTCSIFRTLSMVLVAGGVLGITSFAAADMVTLPNSENWEFKYEGEAPIPDVLGGGRETLPTYHVSPAFGGLANYNLASDGDILKWQFGGVHPLTGDFGHDVILVSDGFNATADREGGWGWEIRFHIPDNDFNAIPFATGRDQLIPKLISGDNPNATGTTFFFFKNVISQGSLEDGVGVEPLAWDGLTTDPSPRSRHVVAEADFTDGFHTFSVIQPPDSDSFHLFLNGDFLGHAEEGNITSLQWGPGRCTGACGHTLGGSDSFSRGEIWIDHIRSTGSMLIELFADFDEDGDVDFNDFSILSGNFTGTLPPDTGGYLPEEGDTDGDGDVDFTDFSVLAAEFTGTITAPAGDTPMEGDVHLEIDLTNSGAMTLEPNNADLAGYSIRSPNSQLVPDADGAAAPFMFYLLNAAQEVTAGSVGATTALASDLALDISFAGDADQAANVVFQYTRAGDVTPVDGIVHVIPEPATMILLAAGGLLMMPRKRRRCA